MPNPEPRPKLGTTIEALQLPPDDANLLQDIARVIGARGTALRGSARAARVLVTGGDTCERRCIATALSVTLGVPLVQIRADEALVSKYAVATERALEVELEAAMEAKALLLVDAADALMGRGALSAPRLAAALSRLIERYEGPLIVGARERRVLDAAFLRRLRMAVEFLVPHVASRDGPWRRAFPQCSGAESPSIGQDPPIV